MRHVGSTLALAAPPLLMCILVWQLESSALYSEDAVLAANVLHPLFNSEAHFHEPFWQPTMQQRDRLRSINESFHGTFQALQKLGVNAFLESSSLIGWMRHGGQIPWDVDGDLGIVEAECIASNASKSALQNVISNDLAVLKFACRCEEDCDGDNKRMVGRVTHKATGVCIDIFAYAPVKKPRPWQEKQPNDVEWWERINDHADYTFPKSVLLPLQMGSFEGAPMLLPKDPPEFLSWEYGRCLGTHVWPWRILLYTPVSVKVPIGIIGKGFVMLSGSVSKRSPWLAAMYGAYSALAMALFHNGITVLMLIVISICELIALYFRPSLCGPFAKRPYQALIVLSIAVFVFELGGSIEQLYCQIDDFYIRPRRPKSWTLCLLGMCWDF